MNAHPALITAGTVFAIIAFVHLLRLIYRSEITISGKIIPMWPSAVGFLITFLLSVWMFKAS